MNHKKILKTSQIYDFIDYCEKKGIKVRERRGEYEIMQVNVGRYWHAICMRDKNGGYLTIPGVLEKVVKEFLEQN